MCELTKAEMPFPLRKPTIPCICYLLCQLKHSLHFQPNFQPPFAANGTIFLEIEKTSNIYEDI